MELSLLLLLLLLLFQKIPDPLLKSIITVHHLNEECDD
jgi:hypothetical protein